MTNRTKLINAARRADLSGFDEIFALAVYDKAGLEPAMAYVNKITREREVLE